MTARAKLDGKDIEYNEEKKKWENSELKTLKDLSMNLSKTNNTKLDLNEYCVSTFNKSGRLLFEFDVRKEVIKWIKEDLKFGWRIGMPMLNRWMKRFNITEEDITGRIKPDEHLPSARGI